MKLKALIPHYSFSLGFPFTFLPIVFHLALQGTTADLLILSASLATVMQFRLVHGAGKSGLLILCGQSAVDKANPVALRKYGLNRMYMV